MIDINQDTAQGVFRYPYGYLDMQRQPDGTWRCNRYDNEYRCHWVDQISHPGLSISRAAAAIAFMGGYAGPLRQIDRDTFMQQRDSHQQNCDKSKDRPRRRIRH